MTHLHGTLTSLRVVTVTSFHGQIVVLKGAVSRNSAKLGNYKMPVRLRQT